MITTNAQLENSNWVFGNNDIQRNINFPNTILPPSVTTTTSSLYNSIQASAAVSDASGQLLFYSEASNVYDNTHQVMDNGDGLLSHAISTAIIVPKPGSSTIYYLFTASANNTNIPGRGFHYSIIDMNGNNGLGQVLQKNIPLKDHFGTPINIASGNPSFSKKLTSIPDDNCGIWVVIQHRSFIYSYKVDSSGVTTTPVKSDTPQVNDTTYKSFGAMKISPNGEKLATAYGGYGSAKSIFLYNFNIDDGKATFNTDIFNGFGGTESPWGVEFSPDSSQLYYTIHGDLFQLRNSNTKQSPKSRRRKTKGVFQYNIADGLKTDISSLGATFGLQRAIDGKIYVGNPTNYSLHVINNPNVPGVGCSFVPDQVILDTHSPNDLTQWVYHIKGSNNPWALNFGEISSSSGYVVRKIRDIETDSEGNTYIFGTKLNQQSTELTNLANGTDFTSTGESFVTKFDACKNLVAFYKFQDGWQDTYGQIHITNDDSIYIEISQGGGLHKLNNQNLTPEWSANHNTSYKESFFIDKVNNNIYLKNDLGVISKINSNDGTIENNYTISPSVIGGVANNNIIYIARGTSQNTAEITKLVYNNGTYTPSGTQQFNINTTYSDNVLLRYSEASNLISVTLAAKQLPNDVNGYNFANYNFEVHTFDTNLNLVSTISNSGIISDIRYNGTNDELLVATHANNTGASFLRKYKTTTGNLVWQANETFGTGEFIISPNISTFDNKILMTGLYQNTSSFSQTNLPNSINNNVDLFSLQIKDLGTTYGYRATTNNNVIGLASEEYNNITTSSNKEDVFTVFPNPFNNTLNISTNTAKNSSYTISISDFVGTNKLNTTYDTTLQRSAIINTSLLVKGVYVLRIMENGTVIHTSKLIK